MQNLIPYVWQMVFANIFVKGWIIYSDIQSLFYGSQKVLTFSSHYFIYHQGLSENFKRTCKKYGVQVHLKGGCTIKNLLMAPKDKDTIWKKSGVIYRYKCNRVDCEEEYIGESARNFAERY